MVENEIGREALIKRLEDLKKSYPGVVENPPHISTVVQFLLRLDEITPWSLAVAKEIGVILATEAPAATEASISDQLSVLPDGRRVNAVLAEARRELKRLRELTNV